MTLRAAAVSIAIVVLPVSLAGGGRLLSAQPATGATPLAAVQQSLDAGSYVEAEAGARTIYLARDSQPEGTRQTAAELYVDALIRNGRGAEAGTLALARTLSAGGSSFRLLGRVLVHAGAFKEAIQRFTDAARMDEADFGRTHPRVADDLDGLARACVWLERYAQALQASNRAVAIYESHRPADLAGLARTLTTRGSLLQGMAQFSRARADLERAAQIWEEFRPMHPDAAATLTALGEELHLEGDVARSRAVLERAVGIAEQSLRSDHPDLAAPLRALAVPLTEAGELEKAKALVERSLAIAEHAYGPVHPLVAMQLNDLADSLVLLGRYAEARPVQQRALGIYERTLGLNNSYVATAVLNLALLRESIGDHREAEQLHRRAIATWEGVVGRTHTYVAWALVGLGDVLAAQGRHREAVPLFARALAIREQRLGKRHDQVAETLTRLSDSMAHLGRTAEATQLADRALSICETSHNPEALSQALMVRARIDMSQGHFAEARDRYRDATAIRIPVFGASHPSVGEAQSALAVALAALGQPDESFATAMSAERIGRDHLRLTTSSLPERQAIGYAASRPHGLDLALSVRPTAAADVELLDAVIRSRALVLDEMATRQRLRAGSASDALRPLWNTIANASQRLANLTVRGPGDLDADRYAGMLRVAREEKEQAEIALAARSLTVQQALTRRDVGLADVRDSLQAGTALVSFVRYERTTFSEAGHRTVRRAAAAYAAFVTRPDAGGTVFVPLGGAAGIDALISRWRLTALEGVTPTGDTRPGSEAALRRIGASLASRIWQPIAGHVGEAGRVFVVPDGSINLVPFAALPVGKSAYLLDDGPAIHYLSAERDLVEFTGTQREGKGKGLLAVGGPAYGVPPPGDRVPAPAPVAASSDEPRAAGGRRSTCGTFETLMFADLPASRREVEDIRDLWRSLAPAGEGDTLLMLTGSRANEAVFKKDSRGHRILHLATHGFFLGADCPGDAAGTRGVIVKSTSARPSSATARAAPHPPESPLLLSGLALSGANRRFLARAHDEDGILTAEEVAALDLDGVEWAVLSACDTGLGEIRAGEGVFGLRRAFRIAGAQTVIMSLWPVEDAAARTWMRALYRARLRDRLSTSEAMRQASLSVLADRRARKRSTHPFFWAGFVAAGDWR